jgi:antitoxin component YwqK of YwqJK toxin-antitoxin module
MASGNSLYRRGLRAAIVLLCTSSLGCFAISRGDSDLDQQPVVNTGVGASIIYPNESAPTYYPPGTQPAPQAAPQQPGAAQPSYGSAPTVTVGPNGEQRTGGGPMPNQTPIQMIGGAEQDITGHKSWKQEPVWLKYLALPFAIAAAPFKAAIKDPEPGPELPKAQPLQLGGEPPPPQAPPAPPTDYETTMVDQLERELDERNRARGASPEPAPQRAAPRTAPSRSADTSGGSAIADELAALQRTPSRKAEPVYTPPPRTAEPTPQAAQHSAPAPRAAPQVAEASGIVDRNGDGRVDQWIYRERGQIQRVELDENADGRPDRVIHYDPETSRIRRVEEDANADGASDSWTEYEDGKVARRRGDGDFNGSVDTWTFYRAGVITRHDQDTDGDGFRDRIGYYSGGKIVREEKDIDGDGRTDSTLYYDSLERISRREEDKDHDGRADVISHYEAGKLSRKELIAHDDEPETGNP